MEDLTPKDIVEHLSKHIIGQDEAKKAIAIALRNRMRRLKLPEDIRDEISPKNILMIGPTGVGKTEIARRIAKLIDAPFMKVEATKYTEVGYVGKDVDSMVRDLVYASVAKEKTVERKKVEAKAKEIAEEKVISAFIKSKGYEQTPYIKSSLLASLRADELNDEYVEVEASEPAVPVIEVFTAASGFEDLESQMRDMFSSLFPKRPKKRRMKISEALKTFTEEETEKLIDQEAITRKAIKNAEEKGIIFIDEIDKLVRKESTHGPDVSGEGVQRDLLPILEGTTFNTRYGSVRTDFILFIAAGAFHRCSPSDLLPELQGRLPIRVELKPLTKNDFVKILKEPVNSILKQYIALIKTEGVKLTFSNDAIEEMAKIAHEVNTTCENIGARRLYTVVEKVLEEISFEAPNITETEITIDANYVRERLEDVLKSEDLTKYIL